MDIGQMLTTVVEQKASDLFITAGIEPSIKGARFLEAAH